jgi:ubiquinone/menaquinone biosynthesis C-methylase UbiE
VSQIEHFDRLAPRYDDLRGRTTEVWPLHELVVEEADLRGRRVLDVGCGTGRDLAVLAEHFGCEIAGVDPSSEMLEVARRRLPEPVDLRLAMAEKLPFPGESFDGALMVLVVHHVDPVRAFPEVRRVLVPGGRLCIVTTDPAALPRFWLAPLFPSYAAIEQRRFPSAADLDRDLRAAGFAAVRCVPHSIPRKFGREEALAKLRGRYASTFDLLGEEEYEEGVARAERELPETVEYVFEQLVVTATR